jgi:uncharacterized FlgJ-related protein
MIYRYDKNQLIYKKDFKTLKILILVTVFLNILSFTYGRYTKINPPNSFEKELILLNVQTEKNSFSKESLVEELKRLNVKYPHIVLAQSIIESGHFQSNIFRANNNLFGMKEAKQRTTTARGTNLGHAYYDNWRESILDYAMFQSAYLRNIKSEQQYLDYLGKNYAEDKKYENKVVELIESNNLKELFK